MIGAEETLAVPILVPVAAACAYVVLFSWHRWLTPRLVRYRHRRDIIISVPPLATFGRKGTFIQIEHRTFKLAKDTPAGSRTLVLRPRGWGLR